MTLIRAIRYVFLGVETGEFSIEIEFWSRSRCINENSLSFLFLQRSCQKSAHVTNSFHAQSCSQKCHGLAKCKKAEKTLSRSKVYESEFPIIIMTVKLLTIENFFFLLSFPENVWIFFFIFPTQAEIWSTENNCWFGLYVWRILNPYKSHRDARTHTRHFLCILS